MTRVLAAATNNFIVHDTWLQRRTPGMLALRRRDVVMTDSGLDCDTFNIVCRARWSTEAQARIGIRRVLDHFGARPFSWWLGDGDVPANLAALLIDEGLHAAESELIMVADPRAVVSGEASQLRIRRIRSREELRAFAAIAAANWNPPDANVIDYYERVAGAALQGDCPQRFYSGYENDTPVATAELTISGRTAGLYNVATLRPFRRRGYGTAMTLRPLLDAKRLGARRVILQASEEGAPVYRRIGFEALATVTEYKSRRQ